MNREALKNIWNFADIIKPGQLKYFKTLKKGNLYEGVFDNMNSFIDGWEEFPDISLYTIPNKIDENCFDDKINIIEKCKKETGIRKVDILSREWWFIDIDVVHDGDEEISATEEEHKLALESMEKIRTYLVEELKFPDPITADSGNGYYILFKIKSLENNGENDAIIKDCTRAIAKKFNTEKVIVDTKVHDISRLMKAVGCKAVKGKETEERKHRYSGLLSVPENIKPLTLEQLMILVNLNASLGSRPTKQAGSKSNIDDEKPVNEQIIDTIEDNAQFFVDQNQEAWATCDLPNGEIQSFPIESKEFKRWCQKTIYNTLEIKAIKKDYYNQGLEYWTMLAYDSGKIIKMYNRIAVTDTMTEVVYDCNTPDKKSVLVKDGNVSIIDTPTETFRREKADAPQVLPNTNTDNKKILSFVKKYFNCATENDFILLTVYIVSCFLGTAIKHPIMIFSGSKGSAKSTATRYIQQIVSPQHTGITMMSKKLDDVAVRLSHSALAVFDNLSQISENISDLLCVAVTGGTYPKRKLFTDNEEIYLELTAMLIMNGVNVVAEKSDLLDRSVNIELKRLTKDNIKSPLKLDAMFQADLPEILGSIFNTVAITLADNEPVVTQELIRMTDFHIYGIKIARALGIPQDEFEDALLSNRQRINERAIDNYPVASLVMDLMEKKSNWKGAVSKLYSELTTRAIKENINTHQAKFPKDAGALTRRLKEVESNLAEVGISFSIRNVGNYKEIEVINTNINEEKSTPIISEEMKQKLLSEDDD